MQQKYCCASLLKTLRVQIADLSGRAVYDVGLRPLAGIAGSNPTGHGRLSLVSGVFCQVEVSASG
jgi:hypothetical protein